MHARPKEKTLKAVRPNAGIEAAYRAHLLALTDAMARSYSWFLKASYRANPPKMAQDETPAAALQKELKSLGIRWEKRFNEAAPKLARYFTLSTSRRSEAALKKILRDAGISVRFQTTPALRDILAATVHENTGLIKSIPAQFHTQVEGIVFRSVIAGHDLSTMTKELQARFGVTRRRAELIARDQSSKATAAFTRARTLDAGITEAVWLHSHAGKDPRPTHLANNGKRYSVETGWFDPDPKVNRYIFPSELINCRCQSKPIVAGFS
jgi:SPP1 gp7 family putative phage head morphogenesis protein